MPNVYVNTKLIAAIATNYKPITREIIASESGKLTKINKDVTNKVFMLNPNFDWDINIDELKLEYDKNKHIYKKKLVQFLHPRFKGEERQLISKKTTSYSVDLFAGYFVDHALYQVCVVNARDLIPTLMLMVCMDIQNMDINKPFDYASVVAESLHNALSDFKIGKSNIVRYYSLLMHIFLYKGLKVWHPDLKIITKIRGEPLLV